MSQLAVEDASTRTQLLLYYRAKIGRSDEERELWLARLAELEKHQARLHQLEWESQKAKERIRDLEAGLQAAAEDGQKRREELRSLQSALEDARQRETQSQRRTGSSTVWPSAAEIARRAREGTSTRLAADAGTGAPMSVQSQPAPSHGHDADLPHGQGAAASESSALLPETVESLRAEVERLTLQLQLARRIAHEREAAYAQWKSDITSTHEAALAEAHAGVREGAQCARELRDKLLTGTREYLLLRHQYHSKERGAAEAVAAAHAARESALRDAARVREAAATEVAAAREGEREHARKLSSFVAVTSKQHSADLSAQAAGFTARIAALQGELDTCQRARADAERSAGQAEAQAGRLQQQVRQLQLSLQELEAASLAAQRAHQDAEGEHYAGQLSASTDGGLGDEGLGEGRGDAAPVPATGTVSEARVPQSTVWVRPPTMAELRPREAPSSLAALGAQDVLPGAHHGLHQSSFSWAPSSLSLRAPPPARASVVSLARLRAKGGLLRDHPVLFRNVRSALSHPGTGRAGTGRGGMVIAQEVNARARAGGDLDFVNDVAGDNEQQQEAHADFAAAVAAELDLLSSMPPHALTHQCTSGHTRASAHSEDFAGGAHRELPSRAPAWLHTVQQQQQQQLSEEASVSLVDDKTTRRTSDDASWAREEEEQGRLRDELARLRERIEALDKTSR